MITPKFKEFIRYALNLNVKDIRTFKGNQDDYMLYMSFFDSKTKDSLRSIAFNLSLKIEKAEIISGTYSMYLIDDSVSEDIFKKENTEYTRIRLPVLD